MKCPLCNKELEKYIGEPIIFRCAAVIIIGDQFITHYQTYYHNDMSYGYETIYIMPFRLTQNKNTNICRISKISIYGGLKLITIVSYIEIKSEKQLRNKINTIINFS